MVVAELRMILEHLPDDLPVYVEAGELCEVRRNNDANRWLRRGVWLDVARRGEPLYLAGRFKDRRTLDVRLAVFGERSA